MLLDLHVVGLASFCNFFLTDPIMIITHQTRIVYPLKKNEFDHNYLKNDVEWLFYSMLFDISRIQELLHILM